MSLFTLPVLSLLLSFQAPGIVPSHKAAVVIVPQQPSISSEGRSTQTSETLPEEESEGHSVFHRILFYIPNRVLDVLDIFRVRVRVGPGFAVGVRATKAAQVYIGTYVSVYAGLPGPRNRIIPRLPVGLESYNGVAVSVVDASVNGGMGPDYSNTEVGFGAQLGIAGFDFGVDPYEILDFAAGLVCVDLKDDDI